MRRASTSIGCLFLLLAGRSATAAGILEHVLTEGRPTAFAEVDPADTTVVTQVDSGIALAVDIPRSSRRVNALFLDVFAQSQFLFNADAERRIRLALTVTLLSDAVPSTVDVSLALAVANEGSTNHGGDFDIVQRRSRRDAKAVIWRDRLGDFFITDKATGQALPEPQAIAVMNTLLDRGFRAEFRLTGILQGVSHHAGIGLRVEVTRASTLR